MAAFQPPADHQDRPVAVVGAGTLGRRIATVYVAGGTDVRLFDVSSEQASEALRHVAEGGTGRISSFDEDAVVHDAWMVVETVPEQLELKREVFGHLDRSAEPDAILASNSSSLPSRELVTDVMDRSRILNTHYQQPPELNAVELMSCGETDEGVIAFLMNTLPRYGLVPFWVRRESDGFILNRIWASIKRECLMVVEEGVATPEDVDEMWKIFVGAGIPPFRLMDRVGLDVVLAIEEHYGAIRSGIPSGPRRLLEQYLDSGRIGVKSGRGFYDYNSKGSS